MFVRQQKEAVCQKSKKAIVLTYFVISWTGKLPPNGANWSRPDAISIHPLYGWWTIRGGQLSRPPVRHHPQFFTSSGSESCCCSVFPYYLLWQQHNLPVLSFPSITETGTISTISITSEDFPHGDLFSANHIQPRPPEKENIYGCHSYWFVIIIAVISLSCFVFVSLN